MSLATQSSVAQAENLPAADGRQPGAGTGQNAHTEHKSFARHQGQRSGEAKLDKLPLPAGHGGVFQHGHLGRSCRLLDVELDFHVILNLAGNGFQDLQFRLGHRDRLD